MDHKLCRNNLSAYLDNELSQEEKAALESHLAECPECRGELADLKAVSRIVKAHAMEPVPVSLKNRVFSPEKRPAAYAWLKPALTVSMAAAGVAIVLNVAKTPEALRAPVAAFGSRAADLQSAAVADEATLPPLPKQKLYSPAAGTLSGSGPESLDTGTSAAASSAKDASGPQNSLAFTGAGGGGGGQAMAARGRLSAVYKADAFSSDKERTDAASAVPGESAPSAPRPKQEAAEAAGAAAGQKPSLALRQEAKYNKTSYAPASVAAVRGASAGASLRAQRTVPVEGFILGTYTAADGNSGKKAVSRFKNASVGTASEADRQACDDYAEFVLDDGTYCILPDGADKEFLVKRFGKEEPGAKMPAKRFWDIFEYGGEKYLLLKVARNDIPAFEYYLLEPRRIRLQGEIELGRP